jgi:exodeoxyribonuclease VII large subunit
MDEVSFTPAEFVAVLNQTLEFSYPIITIEGELSNFRVSKNRWVYFDLKDDEASVSFFGTIYMLPGPLEDGLMVRVVGSPRLHNRFGFSVNMQSIQPVGAGSLKKAADLLAKKLAAEGLFDADRKRPLPYAPEKIGLITAKSSAASADFIKILNERWCGVEVSLADVYVQGDRAPEQIIAAIAHFNQLSDMPEVLVIIRGGGSAEDLAAFSDERVVRSVAASRIPTLVAIGHEIDISLAELAADQRASTPSNAAQLLVPDKRHELINIKSQKDMLGRILGNIYESEGLRLENLKDSLSSLLAGHLSSERERVAAIRRLVLLYDPLNALKRGYALVSSAASHVKSIKNVKPGDELKIQLHDGTITANATKVARG